MRGDEDCCAIHRAIRKYGADNFALSVLENDVPIDKLGEREKYWINNRNSLVPNGYNIRLGGNDSGAIKILQIDPFTGEVINSYPSMTAASISTGIDLSHLSKACRGATTCHGHKIKSAGGFIWRVENEPEDFNSIASINPHIQGRKVYKIQIGTKLILDEYDSVKDAADKNNINQSSISSCLSGKYKSAGGFGWCFADNYKEYKPAFPMKVVQMFDTNGKLLKEFDNAEDASIYICGSDKKVHCIRSTCRLNGIENNAIKPRKSKGYVWRYKDEKISYNSAN